jgi:hypothetical protein
MYTYWQLVTQDLVNWKDDVPRKVQKRLLAQRWTRLKTVIERIRSGEVKARGSYKSAKKALEVIQKYANFEDETYLSAACMNVVRNSLEWYWAELEKEDKNTVAAPDEELRTSLLFTQPHDDTYAPSSQGGDAACKGKVRRTNYSEWCEELVVRGDGDSV